MFFTRLFVSRDVRNFAIVSTARCISSREANSSGAWLIPFLHRTNNIEIGHKSAIADASCVAPEGKVIDFPMIISVDCLRVFIRAGSHNTAAWL